MVFFILSVLYKHIIELRFTKSLPSNSHMFPLTKALLMNRRLRTLRTFARSCSISTDMVSNILSWVELLRSGVVSELQTQKTRKKHVQTVLMYRTKVLRVNLRLTSLWKDTCLPSGHRGSCCSWCTVYWRTPASGRARSPTVWLVFANLNVRQSKQTPKQCISAATSLPCLFCYKMRLALNCSHRLIVLRIH